MAADFAARSDYSFRQTGCALRLRDAFRVRLAVDEIEWVGRNYFFVQFFAVLVVKYLLEPIVGSQPKVIIAMNANLQRLFQLFLVEVRTAFIAPDENVLSADDAILFAYRFDLAFLFAKPGHAKTEVRDQKSGFRINIC